jgi:uncharacterized membrane protein YdjX (TVP38/TMEM64 family)
MSQPLQPQTHHDEPESPRTGARDGAWLKIFLFFLFFAIVLFILYETGWIKVFLKREAAEAFLESLGWFKWLGFLLLQVTQVVLAPIPGEVTGLLGGYLFGIFWGIVLSTIGLTVGSLGAFGLSRAFGRPLVEKVVDKAVIGRFDYLLHHKGIFLIFMLFLLPGFPKDYLCFILGLGNLSWIEFLAVSSLGRLFGTILLTLSGDFFRDQEYGYLAILVGVAIVFTLLAYVFRGKIEKLIEAVRAKETR